MVKMIRSNIFLGIENDSVICVFSSNRKKLQNIVSSISLNLIKTKIIILECGLNQLSFKRKCSVLIFKIKSGGIRKFIPNI